MSHARLDADDRCLLAAASCVSHVLLAQPCFVPVREARPLLPRRSLQGSPDVEQLHIESHHSSKVTASELGARSLLLLSHVV